MHGNGITSQFYSHVAEQARALTAIAILKSETVCADQLPAEEEIAAPARAEYADYMQSLDLTMTYAKPLPDGGHRLFLDVFPAIPTSHGADVDAFNTHFGLRETKEVAGLRSLRGSASLEQVLSFFGATWSDAVLRWPTLSWMRDYRREHGADAYASVDAWQQFYELLSDNIVPAKIEVAMVEHY